MPSIVTKNWAWQSEDDSFFNEAPELPYRWNAEFARPVEVPIDWHRTESQGQIGSCQGWDLTSILERFAFIRGQKVQLSAIFAYLATQRIDGLLGSDSGSTISGGVKLALTNGVCLESLTGYPSRYPNSREIQDILSQENYEAGKEFMASGMWKVPIGDHDALLDFIGGGGGISIGIAWNSSVIPRDRVVRRFDGSGRGGHAQPVLGYDRDGNLIPANSHNDGPYKITPEAFQQMLRHHRTRAIGLTGTKEPPRVDWLRDSPHF